MVSFSLATDGRNDKGLVKLIPLLVWLFDNDLGYVNIQLLGMCCSKSVTAEILFENIYNALRSNEIDQPSRVGVGLDNISVNLGRHNAIKTQVQEVNNSIYINGCPCHIVHNTANKGADMFMLESGFDVEDMLVDIFYWFDKSSKEKLSLKSFFLSVTRNTAKSYKTCEYKVCQPLRSYFLSQELRTNCL